MKRIELRGKYAVGEHQFALVDDDMYDELNRYAWKAKPSGGGNIYAVRNTKEGGVHKTIRMHRVVVGVEYDGTLDIDHINRNPLDNRRENLRLCSRSTNVMNSDNPPDVRLQELRASGWKPSGSEKQYLCLPHTCKVKFGRCPECGTQFVNRSGRQRYCSDFCRYKAKARGDKKQTTESTCIECGAAFTQTRKDRQFCTEKCRRENWNRQRRIAT